MATCVSFVTGADGVEYVVSHPAPSSCDSVVLTTAEHAQLVSSPLNMTLDQAAEVGWLSLAPIIAAFLIKAGIKTLD